MDLQSILSMFSKVRSCGDGRKYSVQCPCTGSHVHGDVHPSGTVYVNDTPYGRKVRFVCPKDSHDQIRDALGLTEADLWIDDDGSRDWKKKSYPKKQPQPSKPKRVKNIWQKPDKSGASSSNEEEYLYRNANGKVMAVKHRTKRKTFFWTPVIPSVFNAPALSEDVICLLENEEAVLRSGKPAICLPDASQESVDRLLKDKTFWKKIKGSTLYISVDNNPFMRKEIVDRLKKVSDVKFIRRKEPVPVNPHGAKYEYCDHDGELMAVRNVSEEKVTWSPQIPMIYHLEKLKDVKNEIYICEGEKDADRLNSYGVTAICLPHGATGQVEHLRECSELWEAVRGKKVVLLGDYDEPGWKYDKALQRLYTGHAESVVLVNWERVSSSCYTKRCKQDGEYLAIHYGAGYDVSDYIDQYGFEKFQMIKEEDS